MSINQVFLLSSSHDLIVLMEYEALLRSLKQTTPWPGALVLQDRSEAEGPLGPGAL